MCSNHNEFLNHLFPVTFDLNRWLLLFILLITVVLFNSVTYSSVSVIILIIGVLPNTKTSYKV